MIMSLSASVLFGKRKCWNHHMCLLWWGIDMHVITNTSGGVIICRRVFGVSALFTLFCFFFNSLPQKWKLSYVTYVCLVYVIVDVVFVAHTWNTCRKLAWRHAQSSSFDSQIITQKTNAQYLIFKKYRVVRCQTFRNHHSISIISSFEQWGSLKSWPCLWAVCSYSRLSYMS